MLALRLPLALAAAIFITGVAHADGPPGLDGLKTVRVDADQVRITFSYQGGACEAVGTAQLGALKNGALAVTFPTSSTAEMCTMQIVTIEVDQTVAADASVSHLDVTLLATDGRIAAAERATVASD